MKFHALCEMFPLSSEKEIGELAADIKVNGQLSPIAVFQGEILDGRNRFLACQKAGVEPKFREWKGDPISLVRSLNLNRRHLTTSQRAMIAAELATLGTGQKPGVQICAPADGREPGVSIEAATQSQAAKEMKVSRRLVQTARQVKSKGSKPLTRAVLQGQVTLNAASKLAKLPKAEQRRVVAQGPASVRSAPRGGLANEALAAKEAEKKIAAGGAREKMLAALESWWQENKAVLCGYTTLNPSQMVGEFRNLVERTL